MAVDNLSPTSSLTIPSSTLSFHSTKDVDSRPSTPTSNSFLLLQRAVRALSYEFQEHCIESFEEDLYLIVKHSIFSPPSRYSISRTRYPHLPPFGSKNDLGSLDRRSHYQPHRMVPILCSRTASPGIHNVHLTDLLAHSVTRTHLQFHSLSFYLLIQTRLRDQSPEIGRPPASLSRQRATNFRSQHNRRNHGHTHRYDSCEPNGRIKDNYTSRLTNLILDVVEQVEISMRAQTVSP